MKTFCVLVSCVLLSLQVTAQAPTSGEEDAVTSIVIYSLLPILVSFSYIFFIFFRKRREDETRRAQAESELKALRAQMNPHFIFNSLNSIYLCINRNQLDEAGNYLVSFSRLMRQTLEHTRQPSIALEDELECLKLYMTLEKLRCPFDYSLTLAEPIDPASVYVPPLVLQPFVENAIVHGFRDKTEPGKVELSINLDGGILTVVIADNGVIPQTSQPGIDKKESLGTRMIEERLSALKKAGWGEARVLAEPILSPDSNYLGRRVTLTLSVA